MTSYRYFDDITVFSTVDLNTGKIVDVQAAQHVPTPLSDGEFDEAVGLAREKSDEVKRLHERFGDQLSVYPQFSQYVVGENPRRHRVVHLNYRVGKRDLSYPRPQVDLTTRPSWSRRRRPSPSAARRRTATIEPGGPRHARSRFRCVVYARSLTPALSRRGEATALHSAMPDPLGRGVHVSPAGEGPKADGSHGTRTLATQA